MADRAARSGTQAFSRPKGTQDILPADMPLRHRLEEKIGAVMSRYGYREIRTPVFESTELFKRGVGEATDIVNKEMYSFEDQGGKSLTLRPELTAPVVRAYLQGNLGKENPLTRLYYLGDLFRQERPQKGRHRQFGQFGAEALGSPHPEQDVEIIALAWDICQEVAPDGLALRINSLGDPETRTKYLAMLTDALADYGSSMGETDRLRLKHNPLRLFDSKDPYTQQLLRDHAPLISENISDTDRKHFDAVQAGLTRLDIKYEIDEKLVRGLDYYTGTVFEITSEALGAQDAVCGGGRYDGLVAELGGHDTPAVGFAAGIERLLLASGEAFKSAALQPRPDVYLAVIGDGPMEKAPSMAAALRGKGISVMLETLRRSLKAQLREANRSGARYTLILGEDELAKGVCSLKSMATGDQEEVDISELTEVVAGRLEL